jgi:hypothetical protein
MSNIEHFELIFAYKLQIQLKNDLQLLLIHIFYYHSTYIC